MSVVDSNSLFWCKLPIMITIHPASDATLLKTSFFFFHWMCVCHFSKNGTLAGREIKNKKSPFFPLFFFFFLLFLLSTLMENNTRLHRRSSSANDVNHYRLPFVHRLSSFRRRKIKVKDDLVSAELILKISIIKACHLNQNDQVSTLINIKSPLLIFIIRPMYQIHMWQYVVEVFDKERMPSKRHLTQNGHVN